VQSNTRIDDIILLWRCSMGGLAEHPWHDALSCGANQRQGFVQAMQACRLRRSHTLVPPPRTDPFPLPAACPAAPSFLSQVIHVTLQWDQLTYTVPVGRRKKRRTKTILDCVSGHVLPGRLLAVMGPTGGWAAGRVRGCLQAASWVGAKAPHTR